MNLLELRTQWIKGNGRYDLVVDATDFGDNGANYYINAGLRMLDNMQTTPKSIKRHQVDIVSGQAFALMQNLRALKEVWMMDGDGRFQLEKKALGWMKEEYADAVADIDTGQPKYYTEAVVGLQPSQDDAIDSDYSTGDTNFKQDFTAQTSVTVTHSLGFRPLHWIEDENGNVIDGFLNHASVNEFTVTFGVSQSGTIHYGGARGVTAFTYDDDDLMLLDQGRHYGYRGILWMVPADGAYTLTVYGTFYSKALTGDGMMNFWSVMHPDILIAAAGYQLEEAYRNTAGMKDWLNTINLKLRGIDHNLVEQDISGVDQMDEEN